MFILPVWAGSLSPDTRWDCICKGGGPVLLDHYSLPSCAHAHCWTWKKLSGSRLLSRSLRKMLSQTVSFFSPTRTPHLEEAHKIKIREIKSERGGGPIQGVSENDVNSLYFPTRNTTKWCFKK